MIYGVYEFTFRRILAADEPSVLLLVLVHSDKRSVQYAVGEIQNTKIQPIFLGTTEDKRKLRAREMHTDMT